jgi:hypothetical protein
MKSSSRRDWADKGARHSTWQACCTSSTDSAKAPERQLPHGERHMQQLQLKPSRIYVTSTLTRHTLTRHTLTHHTLPPPTRPRHIGNHSWPKPSKHPRQAGTKQLPTAAASLATLCRRAHHPPAATQPSDAMHPQERSKAGCRGDAPPSHTHTHTHTRARAHHTGAMLSRQQAEQPAFALRRGGCQQ